MNVERDFNGHAEHLLMYCLDFKYGEFEFVEWYVSIIEIHARTSTCGGGLV
jgi:hypothetical protein